MTGKLSGPLLDLADACDRALRMLAGRWEATEERYPPMMPAAELEGHLRAFPHQATFPVTLDPDEANLAEFAAGPVVAGAAALTRTAAVTAVLVPAACYPVFAGHRGQRPGAPLYVSVRGTCFRREPHFEPLRRQWSFTMREIVCIGTPVEAQAFLASARELVDEFASLIDVAVHWTAATDPFFRPHSSPGYLSQRIQPSKHEATYPGGLALASANLHHDHFGAAFDIERDGAPASTACLAFGVERWLFAVTDRHGPDPASWPDLPAAATAVRS